MTINEKFENKVKTYVGFKIEKLVSELAEISGEQKTYLVDRESGKKISNHLEPVQKEQTEMELPKVKTTLNNYSIDDHFYTHIDRMVTETKTMNVDIQDELNHGLTEMRDAYIEASLIFAGKDSERLEALKTQAHNLTKKYGLNIEGIGTAIMKSLDNYDSSTLILTAINDISESYKNMGGKE